MPNGDVHPVSAARPTGALPSPDTVLRGIPGLKKLPPVVAYMLVMLLTTLGGYLGQGAHGVSATDAQERDSAILRKLTTIEKGQDVLKEGQHDLDKRMTRLEALREAERRRDG